MVGALLQAPKVGIQAAFAEQLVVRAALDYAPVVQNDDLICPLHRLELVSYHDHGTVAHELVERFLHSALVQRIKSARGLVQEDERGIFQQGSSYGDALSLAP